MVDRRHFTFTLAAIGLAAGARTEAAKPTGKGLFELYLEVIEVWKRHDIEAVLSHMADDIVWYVHVGNTPIVGKGAVRAQLKTMAPTRSSERWRVFNHAVRGQQLLVEGVDDFEDQAGRRVAIPYMGILDFRDGLIRGWRDYFDEGSAKVMQNGGPIPAEIQPLLSRPARP